MVRQWLVCAALVVALPAAALGPRGPAVEWRRYLPALQSGFSGILVLKFQDAVVPHQAGDVLVDQHGRVLLQLGPLQVHKVVPLVEDAAKWQGVHAALEARCGCQLANLASYVDLHVDLRGEEARKALLAVNTQVKDLELAFPRHALVRPPTDIAPTTPSFASGQHYREAAPMGVDADYAATLPGGRGDGVNFVDMEVDWLTEHEDLGACTGRQVPGVGTISPDLPYESYGAHGTAVLSILAAGDDGYGVTGLVPNAGCAYAPDYTVEHGEGAARALAKAYTSGALRPGDVFLMESQVGGPDYTGNSDEGLVPGEWQQDMFDTIRAATAAGVIVVEAAGNGYRDLDGAQYNGAFDRMHRDSGAIVVGAGGAGTGDAPRARLAFSNWGSRVDVQGWGEAVYSAGYGDLFAPNMDRLQFYSAEFAGTSSASPIVAGSAILLQATQLAGGGDLLSPETVRDVLAASGTAQTGNTQEHIGPLPDVRRAIAAVRVCGNGRKDALELCEDGNTTAGDGCSPDCMSNETCGNGTVDQGETCDDGNTSDGDGCSASCASKETCGNGTVDRARGEECDDGNTQSLDGCDADCKPTTPLSPIKALGCTSSAPEGVAGFLLLAVAFGMRMRRRAAASRAGAAS